MAHLPAFATDSNRGATGSMAALPASGSDFVASLVSETAGAVKNDVIDLPLARRQAGVHQRRDAARKAPPVWPSG